MSITGLTTSSPFCKFSLPQTSLIGAGIKVSLYTQPVHTVPFSGPAFCSPKQTPSSPIPSDTEIEELDWLPEILLLLFEPEILLLELEEVFVTDTL